MEKALVPVETKKAVLTVQQKANALVVATLDDAEQGSKLLGQVREAEVGLLARKEEITRPLMRSLASVRDLFKPFEASLGEAKKTIKDKLLTYQIAEEERVDKERAKIAAKVEKGTMRADTAVVKLEGVGEAKRVKGVQTRTLTKVRVVDVLLVPREYLVPDMTKIADAVIHQGLEIGGVEKYEEKVLASV